MSPGSEIEERSFVVVGPERVYTEVVCDDGTGPSYDVCDVFLVHGARTRKEARWAAFRRAKKNGDLWASYLDREHPLKGVECYVAGPDEVAQGGWTAPYIVDLSGSVEQDS